MTEHQFAALRSEVFSCVPAAAAAAAEAAEAVEAAAGGFVQSIGLFLCTNSKASPTRKTNTQHVDNMWCGAVFGNREQSYIKGAVVHLSLQKNKLSPHP